MDYKSLNEKYLKTATANNELLGQMDTVIKNSHEAVAESKRVADIAANAPNILAEINKEFEAKTSICNPIDMKFLFVAIGLQCIRWAVLNKLTERGKAGESKGDELSHKIQDKVLKKEPSIPDIRDIPEIRYYYASFDDIVSTYSVPYDAIKGTKEFLVGGGGGLSAGNHRYKTVGHDPLLGFVFGSANILTSTLTNWKFQSYHVNKSNEVYAPASTIKIFTHVYDRALSEPKALGAAVIKQGLHILSDVYTTNGIPLPFVQTLSPKLASTLGQYGIDTGGLIKATASMQTAALFDSLVATVHALYYDETACSLSQYEVRTRKILSVANTIATGSNILVSGITQDVQSLDIGGFIYTVHRLLNDIDFCTRIKMEYINDRFNKIIVGDT